MDINIDSIKEAFKPIEGESVEEGLNLYKLHGTKPGVAKRIEKMNVEIGKAIDDINDDADTLANIRANWNKVGAPLNYDTDKIDEYINSLEDAYTRIAKSVPTLARAIKKYQEEVNKRQDIIEKVDE